MMVMMVMMVMMMMMGTMMVMMVSCKVEEGEHLAIAPLSHVVLEPGKS